MSDESDEESVTLSREALLAVLGGRSNAASAATGNVGDVAAHKEVRLPFNLAERVYIKHDGVWYEVVETEDGLAVEVADE